MPLCTAVAPPSTLLHISHQNFPDTFRDTAPISYIGKSPSLTISPSSFEPPLAACAALSKTPSLSSTGVRTDSACTFNAENRGDCPPSRHGGGGEGGRGEGAKEAVQCVSKPLLNFESQAGPCQLKLLRAHKHLDPTLPSSPARFTRLHSATPAAWKHCLYSRRRLDFRSKIEVATMRLWSVRFHNATWPALPAAARRRLDAAHTPRFICALVTYYESKPSVPNHHVRFCRPAPHSRSRLTLRSAAVSARVLAHAPCRPPRPKMAPAHGVQSAPSADPVDFLFAAGYDSRSFMAFHATTR